MVAMVTQITTLFTDEFVVQKTVSYICFAMVWAKILLTRILLIRLSSRKELVL